MEPTSSADFMTAVESLLKLHEGYERFPYEDSRGFLTVGYGRNLDTEGITSDEAIYLLGKPNVRAARAYIADNGLTPMQAEYFLVNDINHVINWLSKFSWWSNLSMNRQVCLVDMGFNLGENGFNDFKNMINFLSVGNYTEAASEMQKSLWYKQTGQRSRDDLILMIRG